MWPFSKTPDLAAQIRSIAETRDFSRRIAPPPGARALEIARHLNAILEQAQQRDRELNEKFEALTDARDDAQTANQMLRRLKNELKSRSAERDAALSRAEAANEAKSQFLANMSHEIRTPMHGILGIADVLARTSLDARQQSLVQTMTRCGKGLLNIINDVLDFSKIESGRFDLVPRPFSLRVVAEDLAGVLAPRYEKKGIELIVRVDDKLPDLLVGDAERIKQVLTNLLENGLKFTSAGYVFLDIHGSSRDDAVDLTIAVQDTGMGIPADRLDAVFEKFNQVDNSSTRRHEGTGIGLAICRMLVARMDGQITLASTLGEGSTFTIAMTLPRHEPALSMRSPAVATGLAELPATATGQQNVVGLSGAEYKHHRVLLVEDNPVNQEVAKEYLGQMGCSVTIANNGREGVDTFKTETFDLVFMDWLMPEVDGLKATRLIREFERSTGRPRVPVLGLTANAFDKDRATCLAAGMDDVLSKPFTFEELEAMLKMWQPGGEHSKALAASA